MKYPFVKQEGIKDCGVASLQMIVMYYHGYINLEQLRNMTKTGKEGTNAYHLIEAANKIGFEAKGVKCEFDNLNSKNLLLPCIANVTLDNLQYGNTCFIKSLSSLFGLISVIFTLSPLNDYLYNY